MHTARNWNERKKTISAAALDRFPALTTGMDNHKAKEADKSPVQWPRDPRSSPRVMLDRQDFHLEIQWPAQPASG